MKVLGLFAGKARPIGPKNALSGIDKRPVTSVKVDHLGITDDIQVDKRFHGGPERALHQYALHGYETIIKRHPLLHKRAIAGSIGENISSATMCDSNVNIGDIYRIGEIEVQVSSPRIPCWKIEEKLNQKGLVQLINEQQITGWYYRVLETGVINVGDSVTLVSREDDTVNVQTLMRCAHTKTDVELATKLANLAIIDDEWRDKCARISRKG